MLKLPSKEYNEKYLRMPLQEKVVDSDEEWRQCGKWILENFTEDLLWVDEVWIKLQVLLENGTLLMIKASTATSEAPFPNGPKYECCANPEGTVICFTKPEIHEIKRAAEEIRKIVDYEHCMYYKMNSDTEDGIDNRFGYANVSKYMHTYKGFFYRKKDNKCWVLADDDTRSNSKISGISMQKKQEILNSGIERLSRCGKNFFSIPSHIIKFKKLNINMKYFMEKDSDDLCEANILWLVAKKLVDQGYIEYATCFNEGTIMSFRFFPADASDFLYLVKICDIIRKEAGCNNFMYFMTSEGKKYRYTAEGELYDCGKFVLFTE